MAVHLPTKALQPSRKFSTVVLFVVEQLAEKGLVAGITNQNTETACFCVKADQIIFQLGVVTQQPDEIGGMGHGPELGSGRGNTNSQHALHNFFGVLHFLHRFAAEAFSGGSISPEPHKGGLGHVLLNRRKLKA